MVRRRKVLLWCLVLVQLTVAIETPAFKPLAQGVEATFRWIPQSEVNRDNSVSNSDDRMLRYLDSIVRLWDNINVTKGITVRRLSDNESFVLRVGSNNTFLEKVAAILKQYVVRVELPDLAEEVSNAIDRDGRSVGRFFGGKNSFLTGFGLGFLAFGLKKLMLPFLIGAQIFKSILLAIFLPSIIGGIGKIVGKGVTNFASASAGNSLGGGGGGMEDFEFKDQAGYQSQYNDAQAEGASSIFSYAYPANQYDNAAVNMMKYTDHGNIGVLPAPMQPSTSSIANRYTSNAQKVTFLPNLNNHGSFYTKNNLKSTKQQDYKVFHNIPSSSLLLTNYDPFYSPLLSRMDSVFQQLSYDAEVCRERLVCLMYKNPAKFAPYSNLISAQLSRELNELRKPSTDNPEILRFFKYMKAAKDGQDGRDCMKAYHECYDSRESVNPPMVKTYNDINKLVHARKIER